MYLTWYLVILDHLFGFGINVYKKSYRFELCFSGKQTPKLNDENILPKTTGERKMQFGHVFPPILVRNEPLLNLTPGDC